MLRIFRALIAAALVLQGALASAENYPSKPVKVIVGFPAGNSTDSVARLLTRQLSTLMGQPFVVDNRPGTAGGVGLTTLSRAEPDGYTLMLSAMAGLMTAPHLYKGLGYDTLTDFVPVTIVADIPLVLVANSDAPFDNVKELIEYARKNPGKLNYASTGSGTVGHLAMERFKRVTGTSIQQISYQGAPRALQDLAAGNVSVLFEAIATTTPLIQSKRIKVLGVLSNERLPLIDVPPISETVPGFSMSSAWLAVVLPKGVPDEIVTNLNRNISKVLAGPDFQKAILALGGNPRRVAMSPSESKAFMLAEYPRWKRVIEESGAKTE